MFSLTGSAFTLTDNPQMSAKCISHILYQRDEELNYIHADTAPRIRQAGSSSQQHVFSSKFFVGGKPLGMI